MATEMPAPVQRILVPATYGRSFPVRAGQFLTVICPHGKQVGDFVAFNARDMTEYLCTARTRVTLKRIYLRVGDLLYTNRIHPMFQIVADTVGVHDIIRTYCTARRYELQSGVSGHRNCQDNLAEALAPYDIPAWRVPLPFNIFQNCPLLPDGTMAMYESTAKPGDRLVMRAHMDVVAAISACPADDNPVNSYHPKDLMVVISDTVDDDETERDAD